MKKTLLFVVLLGLISSLVLVGCGKSEPTPPTAPSAPSTNAPATK